MPKRTGVTPPTFTPWPVGLFSVAPPVAFSDPHEAGGVDWRPEPWDATGTTSYADSCDDPAGVTDKTFATGIGYVEADAFSVIAGEVCPPVGVPLDERARRMQAALINTEQRAVEAVLWTGDTANGETILPSFEGSTDTALGTFSIRAALAALEGALASTYGGVGIIHAPADAATWLTMVGEVSLVGARLRTRSGTLVVSGGGYPGTGPAGEAKPAGGSYLFATGAVSVRRGEIVPLGEFPSNLDRSLNDLASIGERTYVVGWDGPLLSAIADYEEA